MPKNFLLLPTGKVYTYIQFFQNNRNSLNCRKGSMYLLSEENHSLFFITENKLENKIEDCYYLFIYFLQYVFSPW